MMIPNFSTLWGKTQNIARARVLRPHAADCQSQKFREERCGRLSDRDPMSGRKVNTSEEFSGDHETPDNSIHGK